jgi:rhamnosyltransferase
MIPNPPPKISVIIPIYGNTGNIDRLVEQLRDQTLRPHEIILVDSSPNPLATPPPGVRHLKNSNDIALSWDYNHGARHAEGDYLLNMQQDCLPGSERAIEELFEALLPDRVAATATVTLPVDNWMRYNFWGQALMARWVGDVKQGISGKFDLIRKEVFRRISGYDTENFSFAGEDMDLYIRLSQQGEVFVAPTKVIHLHNQSQETRCRDLFKKHYQLAESFGALFRKWGFKLAQAPYATNHSHHLAKYLYLLLPFGVLFPIYVVPVLLLLSNFTNLEVWRIRSAKRFTFLLINPALFLVGAAGTLKGFITGIQRYSVNK